MKATCWMGKKKVSVEEVPEPQILNARDAIVKVTATTICGSDLHLYNGYMPTMQKGDILGHEFMGEVVELGKGVKNLKVGDRVVVPFCIACGNCQQCKAGETSACENSNPTPWLPEKLMGHATCGAFGYSHLTGGFAGGQAEYVRVPFADFGALKVPKTLTDEQVLFLSDIFPTGYMGAEFCDITPNKVVAVWGAGPVGQFAIASAKLLGAERIIAIDRFPYRLKLAAEKAGATDVINYEEQPVQEVLRDLTAGRGPDACIDAVGLEAHGHGAQYAYDSTKQKLKIEMDRPLAVRDDHGVPQRGHRLDPRCLRRVRRQVPARHADESRADDPHRAMLRASLHEATARADREGRDRSELRRVASDEARRRRARLRHVHAQAGRRHEDRDALVAVPRRHGNANESQDHRCLVRLARVADRRPDERILPETTKAKQTGKMTEPGSAQPKA